MKGLILAFEFHFDAAHSFFRNLIISVSCFNGFRGWLEREYQRDLKSGTIWYLVAISWWRIWKDHVNYQVIIQHIVIDVIDNKVFPLVPM